jgi:Protein of unknown function (DUF3306)
MSDEENFLTRWSRRKRAKTSPRLQGEVGEQSEPGEGGSPYTGAIEGPPHPDPFPASGEREPARTSEEESRDPPRDFDPASLPPIESIAAATDIRAFLAPGVPAELTQAALRRAWATDPAIRDFIGPAENAWDFTAPDGVPGFGSLSADEVQRLAAQFFAPAPSEKDPAVPDSPPSETIAVGDSESVPAPQPSDVPAPPVEAAPVEENATAHEKSDSGPPRRRHGGALAE